MVVVTLTPACVHLDVKRLDLNCDSPSVMNFVAVLNLLIQCSRNTVATVATVFIFVGIALANLEKRSVNTRMYCLPLLFLVKSSVCQR